MKYKFAYSLVEAASELCGADYQTIAAAMSANDLARARASMEEATAECYQCPEAIDCPRWFTPAGGEPAEFFCPQGYRQPPSYKLDDYIPERRYLPEPAEAPAEVIEMCQLLNAALVAGALAGAPDAIPRASLIAFWTGQYPTDKPDFLFDEPAEVAGGGKAEIVLGALLEYLDDERYFKFGNAKEAVHKMLGNRFSPRTQDNVFSAARDAFRNARSTNKK